MPAQIEAKILTSQIKNPELSELPLDVQVNLECEEFGYNKSLVVPIRPLKAFEDREVKGIVHSVTKRSVMQQNLSDYEFGQLSVRFSLRSDELIRDLIKGLQANYAETFEEVAISLSPYVLFPKLTVVYGKDKRAWASSFQSVDLFLNHLHANQKMHGGFSDDTKETYQVAEFLFYAKEAGFEVSSLIKKLESRLFYFLEAEPDLEGRMAALSALSKFDKTPPDLLDKSYQKWESLSPESQMKLAEAILHMNPLHPVQKRVRRQIDKALHDTEPQSLEFWYHAVSSLLYANPKDPLVYEVFAQIFDRLGSRPLPRDNYLMLLAFKSYQEKFVSSGEDFQVKVFLNKHEVMNSELTVDFPEDTLKVPLEKLPEQVELIAQKEQGSFGFYKIKIKGAVNDTSSAIMENGASLTHQCFDTSEVLHKDGFQVGQTYHCVIDVFHKEAHPDLILKLPLAHAARATWKTIPKGYQVVESDSHALMVASNRVISGLMRFEYDLEFLGAGLSHLPAIQYSRESHPAWGVKVKQGPFRINSDL